MQDEREEGPEFLDPDPFAIGLGLIQIISAGATFLEARRQRQQVEQGQRDRFRATYYESKRSLIFFKRTADEFETFMFEGGYARKSFRMGSIRISLEPRQHHAMRRLHGQAMTTANHLADDLDELSDFLGPSDQKSIEAIRNRLSQIDRFPESYRDVVILAREVIALYEALIEGVGERENFGDD